MNYKLIFGELKSIPKGKKLYSLDNICDVYCTEDYELTLPGPTAGTFISDNQVLINSGSFFTIDEKICGYGITLSTAQQFKSSNFPNVKYIIFDEFILEDGQGHYLKNEVDIFLGLIESIARLRDVKVILLGNSIFDNRQRTEYRFILISIKNIQEMADA